LGIFCVNLVHFLHFGILCQVKSGNPACQTYSNSSFGKE
jgi:hypothetical protein